MNARDTAMQALRSFLDEHELDQEPIDEHSIAVVVPGEQKLKTTTSFRVRRYDDDGETHS
jgi:hypothetical protein